MMSTKDGKGTAAQASETAGRGEGLENRCLPSRRLSVSARVQVPRRVVLLCLHGGASRLDGKQHLPQRGKARREGRQFGWSINPKEGFGDLRILASGNLTAEARGVEGTGQRRTISESCGEVLSELCVSARAKCSRRGKRHLAQRRKARREGQQFGWSVNPRKDLVISASWREAISPRRREE
jgi:hypothetical protein